MPKRGALIAVEGLDRTGKSTQTQKLLDTFLNRGIGCELVKFPQRETPIGKLINRYLTDRDFPLSDESAHLLFSANRWEMVKCIQGLLDQGTIVVLDRYVYSGVAYSAAKGIGFDWCIAPDTGLPKPDLTLFFKFSDNSQREGFGDERYEVKEFQDKVAIEFNRFSKGNEWESLDVDGKSIEEVSLEVWNAVEPLINGVDSPIGTF